MTVILADEQFNEYYDMNANKQGIVATAPWATTGVAQLFLGGTLAAWVGRLWALRLSIVLMCIGVYVLISSQRLPKSRLGANITQCHPVRPKHLWCPDLWASRHRVGLRLCIHCHEPLRGRVLPADAPRQFRWYGIAIRLPARHSHCLLGRVRNELPQVSIQRGLESFQSHPGPDRTLVRCDFLLVPGEVSNCPSLTHSHALADGHSSHQSTLDPRKEPRQLRESALKPCPHSLWRPQRATH